MITGRRRAPPKSPVYLNASGGKVHLKVLIAVILVCSGYWVAAHTPFEWYPSISLIGLQS